jgi:septal ring factor EnvC (AmiA/AmiB activator)
MSTGTHLAGAGIGLVAFIILLLLGVHEVAAIVGSFIAFYFGQNYVFTERERDNLRTRVGMVTDERDNLKDQVRELEQDLETVTRHRDSLKSELVYVGWDLETAQQLHKIAEHKLEQAGIE